MPRLIDKFQTPSLTIVPSGLHFIILTSSTIVKVVRKSVLSEVGTLGMVNFGYNEGS